MFINYFIADLGKGTMKIIFYRYGSICEPDALLVFQRMKVEVLEERFEMENKFAATDIKIRHLVENLIDNTRKGKISFVFSMNFFPYVSELCEKLSIMYVCWSIDCPVLELYSKTLKNKCNRVFLFDRIQYEELNSYNPEKVFYLPLATNVERWDKEIAKISDKDKEKYASDVSFVGSLYSEKSPLSLKLYADLSEYVQGYIQGIVEAQLQVYGYNFLREVITTELITELKRVFPDYYSLQDSLIDMDRFVAANYYLGMLVSESERIRLLNKLANVSHVTLYTRSDVSSLPNVICRGGITTHEQMPRVFNLSKINLNITMKGIQSGLPLRIYDVMGCGGFLLTNYQQEIPMYFEIGKDLECYDSIDDCVQKVQYYLSHEDKRKEIADNGYKKVKQLHTYELRIAKMLKILFHD